MAGPPDLDTTTPVRPPGVSRDLGHGGVGQRAERPDGTLKVKGEFAFSSDLWAADMLWGTTLRSPHPHARITSIDISPALATPGVHAVLTYDDVPGRKFYGLERLWGNATRHEFSDGAA